MMRWLIGVSLLCAVSVNAGLAAWRQRLASIRFPDCDWERVKKIPRPITLRNGYRLIKKCLTEQDQQMVENGRVKEIWYFGESGETHRHFKFRYKPGKLIAQGGFGAVLHAWDYKLASGTKSLLTSQYEQEHVAIKFADIDNTPMMQKEMKTLESIMNHAQRKSWMQMCTPSIVFPKDSFFETDDEGNEFFYMVLPYVPTTLEQLTTDSFRRSQMYHWDVRGLQKFAYDILNGLLCVHESDYVHGDIKPANILVYQESAAAGVSPKAKYVLADFGTSRKWSEKLKAGDDDDQFTVVERKDVTKKEAQAQDIWALGITFLTILEPNMNFMTVQMIARAAERMANDEEEDPESTSSLKGLLKRKINLSRNPNMTERQIDLLADFFVGCFQYNAEDRFTVKQALSSRFLDDFDISDYE